MKKFNLLFIIGLLALTACGPGNSGDGDPNGSQDPDNGGLPQDGDGSETPEIYDPAISGLAHVDTWPSEALSEYLTYDTNVVMPEFTSSTGFHHGLNDLFYRVVTRVASASVLNTYKNLLENQYYFTIESVLGLPNLNYAESEYDDVRLYFEYRQEGNIKEIIFDFYDGEGDDYTGPRAVDGLAYFNLKNREALDTSSTTSTRAKWEVRPATMTVYANSSGYNVGGTNGDQLSNPLRIYAGQSVKFTVEDKYYITEIKILAASGYADKTVDNADYIRNATASYSGDYVTFTPTNQPSEIEYKILQVTNVGQVRWLDVRLQMERR